MGYTTKDIAVIDEPKRISLSGLPNFVQFTSKPRTRSAYVATIQINAPVAGTSEILIVEPGGAGHSFKGSTVPGEVGGATYFIATFPADTAENLRQALLSDPWVSANFDIKLPFTWDGTALSNGKILTLTSLGYGAEFNVLLTAPGNTADAAYTVTIVNAVSVNDDSISGEATTAEINLDVYVDAPIFLGEDDKPTSAAALGYFAVTLSKTYSGDPLWLDVNAPFSKYDAYNTPPSVPGWFDAGTVRVMRFIARVAGINNYSFYQSSALYLLRGYGLASDPIDLNDYAHSSGTVKLLTNKPRTVYVRGQREYLNFILNDPAHDTPGAYTYRIVYRAYSTVEALIGTMYSDEVNRGALSIVNTCILSIDDVLTAYPGAGIVRVALAHGTTIVSNDLEYLIRPTALHTLNQFSFLNRLGGWDSFNFDASASEDTKVAFDTYSKTLTPAHTKSSGIETVYAANLDDTFSIVGAPVTNDVADWLKELSASTVVLDSAGRYIIKTEFTTGASEATKNMQVPTMKYRFSETYTNE